MVTKCLLPLQPMSVVYAGRQEEEGQGKEERRMGKRMWQRGKAQTLPENPQEAPWEGGQDGEDQMGLGTPWQPQTLEGVQVQAQVASSWFRADLDADGNLVEPWPAAPSESCSQWVALSSPHSFIFIYLLIHSMSLSLSKHPPSPQMPSFS